MKAHIVSHTHWDREWYQPLGRFRQRLVALVDELLDAPPPPGQGFLLDGQAIILDDYLDVRPERRAELSALLREGRLEAGPWYVLADELIPGGESLVRNLLAGRRTLGALRAAAPPVLYCPDSFGHPATLPAIAQGFGFEAVILWRGYGGARWPAGDAAWWEAPDRSRVLLLHLPPAGYEFGSNLPTDPDGARTRWAELQHVLAPRARLGVLLVLHGADHHARQVGHAAAIDALVHAAAPVVTARAGTLREFVQDALAAAPAAVLDTVRGELRDSYGYTWTLQGTFATRAAQKRTNAIAERTLVRDVEPWAALERAHRGTSRRALVHAAWRALLECHPHDTLCGCSLDAVARAADARWEDVLAQAAGIREDAVAALIGHDAAHAHVHRDAWVPTLIVRNRAARARGGIARLRVERHLTDVGVGPGSAGQSVVVPGELPGPGLHIPHQVLATHVVHARVESPRHYPVDALVAVHDVIAWIDPVPGLGIASMVLDDPSPATQVDAASRTVGAQTAPTSQAPLLPRIEAANDRLAAGDTVFMLPGLVTFECHRDAGDLYTPSIGEAAPPPTLRATRVTASGPLRAAVTCDWDIPGAANAPSSRATVSFSLDAGEAFLRIAIAGEHRGWDERIRIRVATGVAAGAAADTACWADAAFGPVHRRPLHIPTADACSETPPPTAPLHRYVSVFDGARGATLFSDGLGEYEAAVDGTIAITLVRAVGELSRHDLPERPGHAGWPAPTPAAQSPGPFAAELALLHHGGTRDATTIDLIERTADDVLLPLVGDTLRSALAIADPVRGVELEGSGLALSTVKEADDGASIVIRCVNLLDDATTGTLRPGWAFSSVTSARLDETPGDALPISDGAIPLTVPARGIMTLLVR